MVTSTDYHQMRKVFSDGVTMFDFNNLLIGERYNVPHAN